MKSREKNDICDCIYVRFRSSKHACETRSAKSLTLSLDSNRCRLIFKDHIFENY